MTNHVRDEAERILPDHARETTPGRWSFKGGPWHSRETAVDIVETCLLLDATVTDVLTSGAMLSVARRLTALEGELAKLKEQP